MNLSRNHSSDTLIMSALLAVLVVFNAAQTGLLIAAIVLLYPQYQVIQSLMQYFGR